MKPLLKFSAFLGISFLLSACSEQSSSTESAQQIIAAVNPPNKNWNIPLEEYQVNPAKDTLIIYPSGSSLHIPASAFLDKEGQVIKEPVRVHYREFHNPFDIYVAGITMDYDSSGNTSVFETAGMLQMEASLANGDPVFVNPDSGIRVDMATLNVADGYNQYVLDTVAGNWVFEDTNNAQIVSKEEEIDALPEVPAPPKKKIGRPFSIKDYKSLDRSLEDYDNVWFQPVNGEKCGFDCTDYRITDLGNGTVEVVFIADVYGNYYEEKCICYLAFEEGEDYNRAMQQYQKEYGELIARRKKAMAKLQRQWDIHEKAVNQYKNKVRDIIWSEELKAPELAERAIRAVAINRFGIINCDKPISYPEGGHLLASYQDRQGNPIELHEVVLLEKGKNALHRYREGEVFFNPKKENLMWGVTADQRLAYFSASDFRQVAKTSGKYTFKMNIAEGVGSGDELTNTLMEGASRQ